MKGAARPHGSTPDGADAEPQADGSADGGAFDTPKPKRTTRMVTVGVMALTALLAAWMMWSLRLEASYALSNQSAVDLGPIAAADFAANDNRFVRVQATLDDAASVGYRRLLDDDPYRVALAVAADGDAQRWVAYAVPHALAGPRFVPPSLVAGRLVRVARLGVRFGGIGKALEDLSGKSTTGAWIVLDGEDPMGLGWVVGLEVLLALFICFNVLSIARVVRPIPTD